MVKPHWEIDVPVYMNFFNRPDTLAYVFDAVRQARPSKLFLACDGPRKERIDDVKNVELCKKVVSNIDWECEVYTNYSEENLGCGMRMYSGISWAFEYVDRLIILEDDCVPSQDFFPFCEELLERYKMDDRIHMIDAMNHLGVYEDVPYSYFFGPGCCWGWATWKRAWMNMDFNMGFLSDDYSMRCVENLYPYYKNAREIGKQRKYILDNGGKLTAWTYQSGMASALNNQMAIVPKYNLITNIGLTENGVHAVNSIKKIAKSQQAYFFTPTYKMDFPIKHPKYVVEDRVYYEKVQKKFKVTFFVKIETLLRRIIYAQEGELLELLQTIWKRISKKKDIL